MADGEVGRVKVIIEGDDSKLDRTLASAKSKVDAFDRGLKGVGSSIFTGAAIGASMMAIDALLRAADSIGPRAAMSWEKGMGSVIKTTGIDKFDVSGNMTTAFKTMNADLLDLRANLRGVAQEDIYGVASALGSLGVANSQIKEASATVLKDSAAFGMSTDETATKLATINTLWADQTSKMSGASDVFKRVGASVNELGNNYSSTEANILSFMEASGGTLNTWDVSLEKAAAMGSLLQTVGINGPEAATALRSALTEGLFSTAVEKSKDPRGYKLAADILGISGSEFKAKISKDLMGTLIGVSDAVNKMPLNAADKSQLYQKIFGSYGLQLGQKISGKGDVWSEMLGTSTEAFAEGISAEEEYARQTDNLAGAFDELAGAWDVAMITAWSSSLGPAQGIVEGFAEAIRGLTEVMSTGDWSKFDGAIANVKETISNALNGIDWNGLGEQGISLLASAFESAINTSLNIGSWIAAKLTGADSAEFETAGFNFGKYLGDGIVSFFSGDSTLGKTIGDMIERSLSSLKGFGEGVWSSMEPAAVSAFNAVGSAAVEMGNAIITAIVGAVNAAIGAFADLAGSAYSTIQSIGSYVGLGGGSSSSTFEPGRDYRNKNTGTVMRGSSISNLANPADYVAMAEGGFADKATVMFGERGREAYVPIANRAAGLKVLPQVMRELGVSTFADGGVMGWLGEKWDNTKQWAQDNAMTVAQGLAGAEGKRVLEEANKQSEIDKANGQTLTSMQESNLRAEKNLETIAREISNPRNAEITANPWHDAAESWKIDSSKLMMKWDPILVSQKETANKQEKAATKLEEAANELDSAYSPEAMRNFYDPGRGATFKTAGKGGGRPVSIVGIDSNALSASYGIPGLLPYKAEADKGSFAYETGAKFFEDYLYKITPPTSFRWGGVGFGGNLPGASPITMTGNEPRAWLSEGQEGGMSALNNQLRQMQIDNYGKSNVIPWFARQPSQQPTWWTEAATKASPGYAGNWGASKGDQGYYDRLNAAKTPQFLPTANTALTSMDAWNSIYDNSGTCIAFVQPDPSLNFTPGRGANQALDRTAWNAVYDNSGTCIAFVEPDPSLKFTPAGKTAPDAGTGASSGGGAQFSPGTSALDSQNAWTRIYDNRGTCIAFLPPDPSLNFTPGTDYLPGGKGYGNMDWGQQSPGDQGLESWDSAIDEARQMNATLQKQYDAQQQTAEASDETAANTKLMNENQKAAMSGMGYDSNGALVNMGGGGAWGFNGGSGGRYGSFFGGWLSGGAAGVGANGNAAPPGGASWMNAAATSIGGGGAIQWASGGLVTSPTFFKSNNDLNVVGETFEPELILPLNNKQRTFELLKAYLPMRKFGLGMAFYPGTNPMGDVYGPSATPSSGGGGGHRRAGGSPPQSSTESAGIVVNIYEGNGKSAREIAREVGKQVQEQMYRQRKGA